MGPQVTVVCPSAFPSGADGRTRLLFLVSRLTPVELGLDLLWLFLSPVGLCWPSLGEDL